MYTSIGHGHWKQVVRGLTKKLYSFAQYLARLVLGCLVLCVGFIAIAVERQAAWSELKVQGWRADRCFVREVTYRGESFSCRCEYTVGAQSLGAQSFEVVRNSLTWNEYFDVVQSLPDGVRVSYRDRNGRRHWRRLRRGHSTEFWVNPSNPRDSVLFPASHDMTPLLYFGILYETAILFAILWAAWKVRSEQPLA